MRNRFRFVLRSTLFLTLTLLFLHTQNAAAQCGDPSWELSNDCGDIQASGGLASNQPTIFCEGQTVNVDNNSTPANQITMTYIDWGDGTCEPFNGCPTSLTHAYDFPNDTCIGGSGQITFSVRLGVEKKCGNLVSFNFNTFPIAVRFKPVAALTISDQTVCIGDPVDFNNNSCENSNNPQYLWTINGQTFTTENVPNYVFNNAGTYNITLAVTNSCGTDIAAATVLVPPPATASATASSTQLCAPDTVAFTNQSTNAVGYNWMVMPGSGWMFVNNTNAGSANPSIHFTSPGTYTVTMKVNGCGNPQWTTTITVLAPPSVNIVAIPDDCAAGTVSITPAANIGGTMPTVSWQFPGGNPGTGSGPNPGTVSYSNQGTFIVTATVTVAGCGMATDMDTFNIAPAATAVFALSANDICGPDEIVTVNNSSVNANGNYQWNVMPNANFMYVNGTNANSQNPQFKFTDEGQFTIKLTVNACGDPVATQTVNVRLKPSIALSPTPDTCEQTVLLSPANLITFGGGAADATDWTFLNGSIPNFSGPNPPSVSFNGVGLHGITVIASNVCGSQTVTDTFAILAPATAQATVADDSLCAPAELLLVANSSAFAASYQWTLTPATGSAFVNGTSASSQNPQIEFTQEGTFTLALQVTGCGNPAWDTVVHVLLSPIANVAQIPEGCVDVTLNPLDFTQFSGGTPQNITWTFGGGAPGTASGNDPGPVDFTGYGSHFIAVTAQNACGLVSAADSFQIYEPAMIMLTPVMPFCNSEPPIQLQATPVNPNGDGWTGPGVSPGGLFNPAQVPPNLLNTAVPLTYQYGVGTCTVYDTLLVQVNGTVVSAGPDQPLCGNAGLLTLFGTPAGGLWSGNGVTPGGVFDPAAAGSGMYSLAYTFTDMTTTCVNTDTVVVTVLGPPSAALDSIGNICVGVALDLGPYSGGSGVSSCQWDFGDGGTSNQCDPTYTYNTPGTYTLTLYVQNQAGCRDTAMVTLQIVTPPDALFATDVTEGCADLPVTIDNQSALNSYTLYVWNYGNGQQDTVPQPGTIIFGQGEHDTTYTIVLQAINQCGQATDQHVVTVFPRPQVRFGTDISSGCTPLEVNFNNVSVGEPDFFQWYVNGAPVDTQFQLPQQVFLTTDHDSTYYITLVAGNECGFDTVTHSVLVKPNPVEAFFNTDTLTGCQPFTVKLIDYSTQGLYLSWDLGDGNFATGDTVVHTFLQPGQFLVQEFVNNGCGFDTTSATITVLPAPVVSFLHAPFVCQGDSLILQNTSPNLAGSFWDFGDGTADSTQTSPGHVYAQAGNYTIILTGQAVTTGCTATASSPIEVKPLPQPAVALPDSFGCQPFVFHPQNNTSGTNFYVWDFDNGATSTEAEPVYTYQEAGIYSVSLQVTDLFGCRNTWVYTPINVYPKPLADFAYNQAELCVTPAVIQFENKSKDADHYFWDFSSFGDSDFVTPLPITVNEPQTLYVTLYAYSQYFCGDTLARDVKIYTKPVLDFEPEPASGCEPLPVLFENFSVGVNQYAWHFGDGTTTNEAMPLHVFEHAGLYSVTLYASADSLCFDSLFFNNLIDVSPSPTAGFSYDALNDTTIHPNGIIRFFDTSLNAIRWHWDFGDGDSSALQNPVHRYQENGPKVVTLIVFNGIGCPDTLAQYITPESFGGLFIPNALSPESGEPGARIFQPIGVGLIEFEISVYASNGQRVWHSTHLDEGRPDEFWDGSLDGKPLPQGLYWWKARARFYNGRLWNGMQYGTDAPVMEGKVLLIR